MVFDVNDALSEFSDLPEDALLAFAILTRREQTKLSKFYRENEDYSGWTLERDLVDTIKAFDEVHCLNLLDELGDPPTPQQRFAEYYQKFNQTAKKLTTKILIEYARANKPDLRTILVIEPAKKDGIRELVNSIKCKVNELDISLNKKDALMRKLNAFLMELDQERTRTESIFSFAVDLSRTANEVDKNIDPIRKTLERIFKFLDDSKSVAESLPAREKRLQLNSPDKQIEDQTGEFDDEIPF
jgi:hypothetical protein